MYLIPAVAEQLDNTALVGGEAISTVSRVQPGWQIQLDLVHKWTTFPGSTKRVKVSSQVQSPLSPRFVVGTVVDLPSNLLWTRC